MKKVLVPLIIMLAFSLPAMSAPASVERLHEHVDRKLKLAEARASVSHAESLRLRGQMNQVTRLINQTRYTAGNSSAASVTFRLKAIEQQIDEANRRAIASRRLLPFF
jgi:hypothetical protein